MVHATTTSAASVTSLAMGRQTALKPKATQMVIMIIVMMITVTMIKTEMIIVKTILARHLITSRS